MFLDLGQLKFKKVLFGKSYEKLGKNRAKYGQKNLIKIPKSGKVEN